MQLTEHTRLLCHTWWTRVRNQVLEQLKKEILQRRRGVDKRRAEISGRTLQPSVIDSVFPLRSYVLL